MSAHAACLPVLLLLLSAAAPAQELRILTVDTQFLESEMPLYQAIDRAAATAAVANPGARAELNLAADLRKSEVLSALPDVVAEIAKADQIDLVLDKELAKELGARAARDVTDAVRLELERRFADRALELTP